MSALGSYKYKGTQLSSLIKGINSASSVSSTVKSYFNLATSDVVNTAQPFDGVTETPSSVGYHYDGTDIANYSIANYVVPNHNDVITVPSWCNNVRYVLCGGGGGGGKATSRTTYHLNYHNSGYNWGYSYYFQHNSQYHPSNGNAKGGGGGGAGGFVYRSNRAVTSGSTITVAVGSAGGSQTAGGISKVTFSSPSVTETANGGGAASTKTGGGGGVGAQQNGGGGSSTNSASAAGGGSQSKNKSGNNWGKGGDGRATTVHSTSTSGGYGGYNGYVLIYYLS